MARKVFISFLGTSGYKECVYELKSKKSSVVKYVQSALVELSDEQDRYIVFPTKLAIEKNWQGLQDEVKRLFPNVVIEKIDISDGLSNDEIWENFQTIFEQLEDNDELTVDITHSFRSIPLLASALLQYAKFLKNISVKAIHYGAFETLGTVQTIDERYPNPEDRIVPVLDLKPFSDIQDWATAANDFITFGDTKRLLTQCDTEQKSNELNELKEFNDQMKVLSGIIKTNRGKEIISGNAAKRIIDILDSIEQNSIPALNPILEKIKVDVKKVFIKENDAGNMLAAVEWCIDKQLIQEGFTILQEGIVTLLLPEDDHCNRNKREFVSAYLQNSNNCKESEKLSSEETEQIISYIKSCLAENMDSICKNFKNIASTRNDINHAGMTGTPMRLDGFEKNLRKFHDRVKAIFS